MQPEILNKMEDNFNQFQGPLKEITELSIKAFQNISYVKPEEWSQLQRPEELLHKSINVFLDNAHKTLNYLEEVVEISQNNWLSASKKMKENTEQAIKKTDNFMKKNTAQFSKKDR